MLTKELERAGIPTAMVTALLPTARMAGAHRVVAGVAITHPLGDPALPPEEEAALRRRIVADALRALTAP